MRVCTRVRVCVRVRVCLREYVPVHIRRVCECSEDAVFSLVS